MEQTRVITLSPNTFISNVVTFDEVFDEYSEARGDRRAKRTARKVERQQAKAQVQQAKADQKRAKVGKRFAKREERQVRKTGLSDMRQARRTGRSEQRQDRRTGRSAATQQRRTDRRASTMDRRAMRDEFEPELQDEQIDEPIDDRGYNEEEEQYVPQGGGAYEGETFEDERVDDSTYEEDGSGNNFEQGFQENFGNEDSFYEEPESDGYDFGAEYDSYQDDEPENDFNFDGNVDNSDEIFDLEQASQVIEIPTAITVTADCIEWNKEMYSRLDGKKKQVMATTLQADVKPYDEAMIKTANRVAELEDYLNGWADCKYNCTSDNKFEAFPTIDTDYSNANGQMIEKVKRGRAKRVKMAKAKARKKRDAITKVKANLNPIIDRNKIVIPSSSFEGIPQGTGLIGLDDSNDYDAPNELDIELTSNASGSSKVNMNAILIGVGLAALGIYAIKKFNLIK